MNETKVICEIGNPIVSNTGVSQEHEIIFNNYLHIYFLTEKFYDSSSTRKYFSRS